MLASSAAMRSGLFQLGYAVYLRLMSKIKVDLHEVYNNSYAIEKALQEAIDEAVMHRIKIIEIIPGKGSGQLKKKVLRFLQQKHIKAQYHRIDKDSNNWGRLFVRFKH